MSFKELKLLRTATKHLPQGHEVAGAAAEEAIKQQLKKSARSGTRIFQGKRVPRSNGQGRYEIDLILVTSRYLYILEVKNFSGSLQDHGTEWIQTKRNGATVSHQNIVEHNQNKLEALKSHLSSSDIDIPDGYIQQRVLFYNNLKLAQSIEQDPRVVTHQQIQSFLPKRSILKGMEDKFFAALITFLVDEERRQDARSSLLNHKLAKSAVKSINQAVGELRTWDCVGLYGGRVLTGDAKQLFVDNDNHSLRNTPTHEGFSTQWTRSRLLGFCKALSRKSLGKMRTRHRKISLNAETDRLRFRPAGSKNDIDIYLRELDWFSKG